jgi:hypothetical protein
MSHKPAGGSGSRVVVSKPVRTGKPNRAVRPGGADQIGTSVGSHATNRKKELPYRGVPVFGGPAIASELGNKIAAQTKCGVGGSRVIHKTGSQQGLVTRQNSSRGRSFDD